MTYDDESDLKYIDSLDSLPLGGPDEFTPEEKLKQAAAAESRLETAVNDGAEISSPEAIHADTAAAFATYRLFVGPEHPRSSKAGDFSGGSGDDTMEVAREYKSMWREGVDDIISAGEDESELDVVTRGVNVSSSTTSK